MPAPRACPGARPIFRLASRQRTPGRSTRLRKGSRIPRVAHAVASVASSHSARRRRAGDRADHRHSGFKWRRHLHGAAASSHTLAPGLFHERNAVLHSIRMRSGIRHGRGLSLDCRGGQCCRKGAPMMSAATHKALKSSTRTGSPLSPTDVATSALPHGPPVSLRSRPAGPPRRSRPCRAQSRHRR